MAKYRLPAFFLLLIALALPIMPCLVEVKAYAGSSPAVDLASRVFLILAFAGLGLLMTERVARLYSVSLLPQQVEMLKWGRRRRFSWRQVTKVEWSSMLVLIHFGRDVVEVHFLVFRDRPEVSKRILKFLSAAGLSPDGEDLRMAANRAEGELELEIKQ